MILTAGFGTRLRPLTHRVPKPLLPVANRPLLEYTFALLAGAGVREVIINVHYLADEMMDGLRRLDTAGLAIHISQERRILGTAGGPKRAAPFLEGETFLLLNGDFLVDIDLHAVIDFHRSRGTRATMVLREDDGGGIHIDKNGRIRQFLDPRGAPSPQWTRTGFTGIHVLEPEVLTLIPKNSPWEINKQVYPAMLEKGWPVYGFLHDGYWREAGDPAGYLAANLEMLSGGCGNLGLRPGSGTLAPQQPGRQPPVLMGKGVVAGEGVVLGPEVVVGDQTHIGEGARIRRSVILEGTDVPAGSDLESIILAPEGSLPAGTDG
jgi:NDP-sugar pyrophosphorylase family protein